ncbi:DUF2807 domain-containing protein [Sphingobacterium psychroaquaticum]|uniref:head GIN domain-containing protein n=1 Tax=Sphingobacterium psychroaquaticum TaxID=561061 RepID=UPI00106CFDE6|nr:head GIN domain-containing protein [Sphingobacterium psychroaquaticum]QBQ40852.1 DUF2807 domain-containing protein [Sphingobacterium psychroaquaticum]
MRKLLTIAFVSCLTLGLQAQHKQTRKISTPSGVSVATSLQTEYIRSNRNEVIVEAEDAKHLEQIETVVKDNVLYIRYKRNTTNVGRKNNRITVYASTDLKSIEVSSSGSLTINDPIQTNSLDIDVSSSGKLQAGRIQAAKASIDIGSSGRFTGAIRAQHLEIDASSSGKLTLTGEADQVSVDMSSSANLDLSGLKAKSVQVDGSSSAYLSIQATESIRGDVSSSAKIEHIGTPKTISVSKSSSGRVTQK